MAESFHAEGFVKFHKVTIEWKHFEMKNVHVKSEISFLMNHNEILFL